MKIKKRPSFVLLICGVLAWEGFLNRGVEAGITYCSSWKKASLANKVSFLDGYIIGTKIYKETLQQLLGNRKEIDVAYRRVWPTTNKARDPYKETWGDDEWVTVMVTRLNNFCTSADKKDRSVVDGILQMSERKDSR
jgi:hypothetical protein